MSSRIIQAIALAFVSGLLLWGALGTTNVTRGGDAAAGEMAESKLDQDERRWIARRIVREGCVLRLLVAEASTIDDLPFEVVLQNRGAKRVTFGETGYFLDCTVTLTGKDGNAVPLNRHGRYIFPSPGGGGQYANVTLSSREARSWTINLAEAFEPLSNGEYVLALTATVVVESPNAKPGIPESEKFKDPVELVVKNVPVVISSKK